MARNLTDPVDGFLKHMQYLIHDRDPVFTSTFTQVLKTAGVKTVKLPAKSPNLNAVAERFVRSAREECVNRVIPLGEQHLRTILGEYLEHYHRERNHQGLDNQLITPQAANENGTGPVRCRERLGGMLHFYYREAA